MGRSKDLATLKSGLSIDGTLTTTSTGTNLTSNSYNVVKIQTDKDDNGSNDDAILQFTTGSSNTVKGELRYDESQSLFEIGHGDNQGHITIDNSGYVRTPNQPSFHAKLSSNQTGFNATSLGNHFITFDSEVVDQGNNHSGGVFTAPVAGTYFFKAEVYGSVNFTQAWLCINGGRSVGTDTVYITATNFAYYENIVHLSANDTVSFHPYHSSNSNVTINANNNHTWWKGHFLG